MSGILLKEEEEEGERKHGNLQSLDDRLCLGKRWSPFVICDLGVIFRTLYGLEGCIWREREREKKHISDFTPYRFISAWTYLHHGGGSIYIG